MLRRIPRLVVVGLSVLLSPVTTQGHPHEMPATVPTKAPIFDLGKWHHTITTSSPEAQTYFDQGLNLMYGFNHAQAIIAFEEAARLDSTCAMAYWGKALALGPNINWPMEPAAEDPAWHALEKAVALAGGASEPERAYIQALAKRYADPTLASRPSRVAMDSAYADAMREVAKRHPDDADAGALFAESLMDLTPWNYWAPDGTPGPGTGEILATLEAVLGKTPLHPGANHFYIHALEASPHPERAAPAAERLGGLVPDAGHLVHMPGHIWHRLGRYNEAGNVNVQAARIDSAYVEKYRVQGVYPMMYYTHNVHFIWSSACFAGRSTEAITASRWLASIVPAEMVSHMPSSEFFCPSAVYGLVRFGRWSDILEEPPPPGGWRFTTGMWHFARGFAFNATGQTAKAQTELDSVVVIAAEIPPDVIVSFNSAAALLRLAGQALAGEMAAKRGKLADAIRHFHEAIREEDALHYDEPPAWFMPVRQELGAVLLAAGRAKEAEVAYREDLRRHPENGWSLFGLAQCLRARKAGAEAAEVEKRFEKAWSQADVKITSSRF